MGPTKSAINFYSSSTGFWWSDDSEIKRSGVELTSKLIGKDKNKYKQIIADNIKYENLLEITKSILIVNITFVQFSYSFFFDIKDK